MTRCRANACAAGCRCSATLRITCSTSGPSGVTGASLWIASGANPKVVQTKAGHSSIKVTYDRYGHLFPDYDDPALVECGLVVALVQVEPGEVPDRQRCGDRGRGAVDQQAGEAGVLGHEGEALGRVRRIERPVGGARRIRRRAMRLARAFSSA